MKVRLSKKEMKTIGFILGCVLVVALVGVGLNISKSGKLNNIAGAAIQLDPKLPTYPGVLGLLKTQCEPKTGSGNCNSVCGNLTCVPIEEDCSKTNTNGCWCCTWPK